MSNEAKRIKRYMLNDLFGEGQGKECVGCKVQGVDEHFCMFVEISIREESTPMTKRGRRKDLV